MPYKRLRKFNKLVSSLESGIEPEARLERRIKRIVKKLRIVLGVEYACIILFHKYSKSIGIKLSKEKSRNYVCWESFKRKGLEFSEEANMAKRLCLLSCRRRARVTNDARKSCLYNVMKNARSMAGVPIFSNKEFVGVIHVESVKKNHFDKERVNLLKLLSNQFPITIANVKLHESLQHRTESLLLLNEASKIINSTLEIDKILQAFVRICTKRLKYDFVAILWRYGNTLSTRIGAGFTPNELEIYKARIGEGICGMCAKLKKPIVIGDVSKCSYYLNVCKRTKSEMAVPIKIDDEVVGVFNVESSEYNAFSEDDLAFLSSLAEHVSIALKNAELYEEVRNFNKRLLDEVNKATKELVSVNKELMKLNHLKSEFVNTVSHELRTPLTSIYGYVSLLESESIGELNEQQKEFVRTIKAETQRLTDLINDLLDLSRIESGKIGLYIRKINLKEFFKKFKGKLTGMAAEKGIRVSFNIPDNITYVKADSDKLLQVLINLMSNAVKFTPEEGKVNITVKRENKMVKISVRDTGIGIEKKHLDKIFHRFYQVKNDLTKDKRGTGLGLAICKHLIRAMNGRIWAESEGLNRGSTFSFVLPVSEKANKKGS